MNRTDEEKKKVSQETGKCFADLRLQMQSRHHLTDEEFFSQVNIPGEIYRTYELCEQLPGFEQLRTLGLQTGVNLNWLVYRNGSMFGAREKDMEELILHIEADKTGHYEDYKQLLHLLQVPAIEKVVFYVQDIFMDSIGSMATKSSNMNHPNEILKIIESQPDSIYSLYLETTDGKLFSFISTPKGCDCPEDQKKNSIRMMLKKSSG